MKKILSLTLAALLIVLSFSGCKKTDGSEYKAVIENAFKKTDELSDLEASILNETTFDNGDNTYSTSTKKDYRVHSKADADKFEMSEETNVTTLMTNTEYDQYFKDGKLYTNRYGGNFFTKASPKDTGYFEYSPIINISYDDIKAVSISTASDSSEKSGEEQKIVTFECKAGAMTEIAKSSIGDDETITDIKVTSASGEYQINSDGYLTYQKLKLSVTFTDDDQEYKASVLTSVTLKNVGEKVNPYDPDEDTYYEIDDINTAAELYTAMTATINSKELEIEFEGSADIKQESIDAGYKRKYHKIYSDSGEQLHQTTETDYFENGKKTNTLVHGQYFKDGVYSNRNDSFQKNLYSKMDYTSFMANMFGGLQLSPVEYLAPGMMENLKSETKGDTTIYSFGLNAESDEGVQFVGSLFGAFVNFGGDVATAKIRVKSFTGKSYVDKDGYYKKSDVTCELVVEFDDSELQEGEDNKLTIVATQTINAKPTANVKGLEYPDITDYKKVDKADLFSATK